MKMKTAFKTFMKSLRRKMEGEKSFDTKAGVESTPVDKLNHTKEDDNKLDNKWEEETNVLKEKKNDLRVKDSENKRDYN